MIENQPVILEFAPEVSIEIAKFILNILSIAVCYR